jgi:dienelactone hydrolase
MRFSFLQAFLSVSGVLGSLASVSAQAATEVPLTLTQGNEKYMGTLFLPEHSTGSVPLVIVVPEWWGKNAYSDRRARMVADELGAAALSVDVYGNGKVVETPTDAMALSGPFYKNPEAGVKTLNAFLAAAPSAAQSAKVTLDPSKVLAIGYCFGGTQVLNLARSSQMPANEKLIGVVSFHGGLASSMVASGPIAPKLLVFQGEADQMVKPADVVAFKKEMKADHAKMEFISYPGAQHAFTNPKATEIGEKYKIPVAYNENADKKSWAEFKKFYTKLTAK